MTLRSHNSFQNSNNRKATHSFASRPLIFKLQQEVLKFSVICVSWRSPKTDLVSNRDNRSFENVSIVTFKYVFDIPLLNNLFLFFFFFSIFSSVKIISLLSLNWIKVHPLKERFNPLKVAVYKNV